MQKSAKKPRPLKRESLDELALAYVARFATSQAKLTRYLNRKLRERGWDDADPPQIEMLVERIAGYGYVNDAAYAEGQARSLTRRGYGRRRVNAALTAAGIDESDRESADQLTEAARVDAAWRYAERRRWGPFATEPVVDRAKREKMIAAFLRAGHEMTIARAILAMAPGQDRDALEQA